MTPESSGTVLQLCRVRCERDREHLSILAQPKLLCMSCQRVGLRCECFVLGGDLSPNVVVVSKL